MVAANELSPEADNSVFVRAEQIGFRFSHSATSVELSEEGRSLSNS